MNWTGRVLVARQLHDVLELLEDQRRALVGGKPPREADGQRVRVQQLIERDEVAVRQALALDQQPAPGKLDQLPAQLVAQRPELLVGDELRVRHRCQNSGELTCVVPVAVRRAKPGAGPRWRSWPVSLRRQNRRTVPFIQPSR